MARADFGCGGVIFGLILMYAALYNLFLNERKAAQRYDALERVNEQAITVSPRGIDPSNDGRLVHFSVEVSGANDETLPPLLLDPVFGVTYSTRDCLRLERRTELYQWRETKRFGEEIYSYNSWWYPTLANSSGFADPSHENPDSMRFQGHTEAPEVLWAGDYQLPGTIVEWLVRDSVRIGVTLEDIADETLRNESRLEQFPPHYYFGNSIEGIPTIGDQKVWFVEKLPEVITVVGTQTTNGSIEAFAVNDSALESTMFYEFSTLIYERGNWTIQEMMDLADQSYHARTWTIRWAGLAFMVVGGWMVSQLGDRSFCRALVGVGVGFALWAGTISASWLIHRPTIGFIVLGVSMGILLLCGIGASLMKKRLETQTDDASAGEVIPASIQNADARSVESNDYDISSFPVAVAIPIETNPPPTRSSRASHNNPRVSRNSRSNASDFRPLDLGGGISNQVERVTSWLSTPARPY